MQMPSYYFISKGKVPVFYYRVKVPKELQPIDQYTVEDSQKYLQVLLKIPKRITSDEYIGQSQDDKCGHKVCALSKAVSNTGNFFMLVTFILQHRRGC